MAAINDFIIIDDDGINNTLCRKIIEKAYPEANITDFTDPEAGFNYIVKNYSSPSDEKTVLLLDISMPAMNAWEFLDLFNQQNEHVKNRVKLHILSSSVNKHDMTRAQSNPNVEYYLIKPLTKESIRLIVHVLYKRIGMASS